MTVARSKTLDLFRKLHKTRLIVFKGDNFALEKTRTKINEEFRKNIDVSDTQKLQELWQFGEDVNLLLRKTVIQCEYDAEKNRYKANVRDEIIRDDPSAVNDNDGRGTKTD